MATEVYAIAATETAKMINSFIQALPKFNEKQKKKMEKETNKLIKLDKLYRDAEVAYGVGSISNELLGIVDAYNDQEEKLKMLYKTYEKELKS